MAEQSEHLRLSLNTPASVLLVDDNPSNLLSLRAILDDLGQHLVEARSGEEALQRIQSNDFAVVLLDVLMPGISGFQTAKLIRGHDRARHTPIIFLTASDIDRAQIEEGYGLGAVDFLEKPLLPIVLKGKVQSFVELFQDKQQARREADQLRLLVDGTTEYAIFMLDANGRIVTWNPGAERLKGYARDEIVGQHFSRFYPPDAIERGWPEHELEVAQAKGRFEDEGWRIRKDGSRFWANVVITALRDEAGMLLGFSKITRDMTERMRAEENARRLAEEAASRRVAEESARLMQEQKERLQVTLASIGDAVISTDRDGRITFLNPVAESLVGWKTEEAATKALADVFCIVNEGTRQQVENPATRALREGTVVGLANHTVLISKQGTERPIDDSAAPIRDAEGNVVGSVLVFRDISDRKQHEKRLREEQEWLRVTLASIGDAVIATDTRGHVTLLNGVAQELTGWSQEEAAGQPLETIFPIRNEQSDEPVENPVGRVLRDGVIVGLGNHTVLTARDGTTRPIDDSAAPIRDAAGNLIGVVLIFRDVTEHRLAEQELRASEARKSAILETALDCVIVMDHEGMVVEFNPAAEATFGYRRTDIVGQELARFIIPPALRERHRQGMAHYLATGEGPVLGKRIELHALHADGSEFPVELAITRIAMPGPPLFTAYLRDVSERAAGEQYRAVRFAITHALIQAVSVHEAAVGVLAGVCENLAWDVGFFWMVDSKADELVCIQSWHMPNAAVTEFETVSCGRTFQRGEGLPGRVWVEGGPAWILDVPEDDNFPRATAAADNGLHSAFACPIIVGEQPLGVIEFFTKHIREPDADLLELMATICGQVGQFIERKQAEDRLRQSEEELADFFENATVGLHLVGPDGTILRANRAELDLLGYSPNEYLGRSISEFHADEDVICDILERLQAGEKLDEYPARLRCKDGTIKDVLIDSSVLWKDGQFVHTRCFTRDVTERKRTEEALRRSEWHQRLLADVSAELVGSLHYQSVLRQVADLTVPALADVCFLDVLTDDERLERVGWKHIDPAAADLSAKVRDFPVPLEAEYHPISKAIRTGVSEFVPEITAGWLQSVATTSEHLQFLRDLNLTSLITVPMAVGERRLGAITFCYSVSRRQYTAEELSLAEEIARRAALSLENAKLYEALRDTDRRKDEFLATLAHELRNPLAPIRNSLQILKMPRVDATTAQQTREMMERQVHHLVRLVDDLLDVSRVMRGKIELQKEFVELASIVARAVETAKPLIEVQSHELNISLPDESLLLHADPVRLAQVIGNLLTNAAKYTEAQGRIWVTASRDGDHALLRIRDNGVGIAPDMLPRVFELFVQAEHASTRSQGGLGIGLTLVKNLVEMHGGTVKAYSAGLGRGCEFVVTLPLSACPPGEVTGEDHAQARRAEVRSGYRIMVVDDNQDAANSLAMLLRLQGHEAIVAHDGQSALAMAPTVRPNMMFLDIGMPGMDGHEVARRVRQRPDLNPVMLVALTGWGQQEDRRRSAEAGFDHHLVKPPNPDDLANLLASLRTS